MSEPYVGVEMRFVEKLRLALANSERFRVIVGAVDAAAAELLIVEMAGEAPDGAYALIGEPRFPVQRTPGGAYTGILSIEVGITYPPTEGSGKLTEAEELRRAWGHLSIIRRDVLTYIGVQPQNCDPQEPVIMCASDPRPGWIDFGFDFRIQAQAV